MILEFHSKLTILAIWGLISIQAYAERIYVTGNTKDFTPASTTSTICLAGGASDDLWSDGWKRMLQDANGGDVVIIRAYGS